VKAQNGKEGKGTEGVIIIDGIGANTGSLAHCVSFAHGACRPSSDCLLIELQFGGSEELASGSVGEVVEGCFPPLPLCLRKVQHGNAIPNNRWMSKNAGKELSTSNGCFASNERFDG
jgi:hypothetical protein